MSKLAAWQVDPAWPFVPDMDDDDLLELEQREAEHDTRPQGDLFSPERAVLARRVAELHVQGTRLLLRLHNAQRALERQRPPAATPPKARQRGGRPTESARNDRLLALFDATPTYLPHIQRCRLTARRLAAETAERANLPLERVRVLPATTVRDGVAEARRRRG